MNRDDQAPVGRDLHRAGEVALGLDLRGDKQSGEGSQSGKQQRERRKAPGRDYDLPPASQD